MSNHHNKLLPSEHTSITISRKSQDINGNQTSSRTYCSIIKRGARSGECNEPKSNQQVRSEKRLSNKTSPTRKLHKRKSSKFNQIPLFPSVD